MEKHLRISSEIENLSLAENLVDEVYAIMNMNSELYGNVLVALIEAVNNAIQHGNKNDPSKFVDIYCSVDNELVSFVIIDEGVGFNYRDIPDPTKPENIEKPHGRGVFLINHLADSVNFYRNGAEIHLKFNIVK
ncbi:MAG TPA: ATP-binding protein [Bacteroidales bacterium]|nr:ATP-binding protein [Bacteroidales bacterium]